MLELEREDVVSSKESLEFPEFPLERARLRGMCVLTGITVLGTVGYGLLLMTRMVRMYSRLLLQVAEKLMFSSTLRQFLQFNSSLEYQLQAHSLYV